jgi:hypothetical protein
MSRLLLDGGRERALGGVAGAQVKVPSVVTNQDSLVPGSTATLNSAIDAVRQLIAPLPLVPPVVGKPALPSVRALPLPTSVPGLPSPLIERG